MLCGCCAHVVPGQRKPQPGTKIKTSGDFEFEERGEVMVKGAMRTWFLGARKGR
jgi:hypothetical protein